MDDADTMLNGIHSCLIIADCPRTAQFHTCWFFRCVCEILVHLYVSKYAESIKERVCDLSDHGKGDGKLENSKSASNCSG